MANKHAGEVALTVDGKTYVLRATHNSMANYEDLTGRSVFDLKGGGVRTVRALLFSMAEGQHGMETLQDAGALIDADPLEVTRAVNEATALFFRQYRQDKQTPATATA